MKFLLAIIATSAAAEAPCDILAAAGNDCVVAHSTVRALYAQYSGPLYRVIRPNKASANISVLEPGGFAEQEDLGQQLLARFLLASCELLLFFWLVGEPVFFLCP